MIISKFRSDVTWKRYCDLNKNGCGNWRCFSIFPGDSDVCGICISIKDPDVIKDLSTRQLETDPRMLKENNDNSNWVQCKTCCLNYSVTCINNLNVRSKCHPCRNKLDHRDDIVCHQCLNKYNSPGGSAMLAMIDAMKMYEINGEQSKVEVIRAANDVCKFVCPRCVQHPQDMTNQLPVKINELIIQNDIIIKLIPVTDYDKLMKNNIKLWKKIQEVELLNEYTLNDQIEQFASNNPEFKVLNNLK